MSQDARNAIRPIGAAITNTVWIDWAYAADRPCWTAVGSVCKSAGVTLEGENPLGSLALCRCLIRLPTSTLEKIAPKIAVPKDPPMDRKNVCPEVATPSSE